jgi:hypothetical protein
MLTGHNFLNRHQGLVDKTTPKGCTFCEYEYEEETASHLITDCEKLWKERGECFKSYFLDKLNPEWDVSSLTKFLNNPQLKPRFEGNVYNPTPITIPEPPLTVGRVSTDNPGSQMLTSSHNLTGSPRT